MISLQMTSTKIFMYQLLAGEAFDSFLLEEALISTANTYHIDGHINRDFFPPEEQNSDHLPYACQPWSEIKGLCFDLMKGKNTPLHCKFILQLKPEATAKLLERENISVDLTQLKALVLNIRYDGSLVTLTTGTSYHTFVPDRDADIIWDREIQHFLTECGIPYDIPA